MSYEEFMEGVVRAIEAAGVLVIVAGAIYATSTLARGWTRWRREGDAYAHYRRTLGRAILLGLEFLIAADIIRTVAVSATLESVATLAAIVLIRTFLSFALEVEIGRRWPWQQPRQNPEA